MRQVQGSTLVDTYGKVETLADLLDVRAKSLKLETLFSTRSSGWHNPAAFHTACDHKGPTLTIIQVADGGCYGGCTSVSWNSNEQYQSDAEAFLFQIANFEDCRAKQAHHKFVTTGSGNEVYCSPQYGPIFGAGNDLLTFSSSAQTSTRLTCRKSSFSTSGPLIPATTLRDASRCQMEVLLVSTLDKAATCAQELEAPWLTGCAWSQEVTPFQYTMLCMCLPQ